MEKVLYLLLAFQMGLVMSVYIAGQLVMAIAVSHFGVPAGALFSTA